MQKAFYIKDKNKFKQIANEAHEAFLAAVKKRNPKAKSIIEDPVLAQLHTLLPLIQEGELGVSVLEDDIISIEIYEEQSRALLKRRKTKRPKP